MKKINKMPDGNNLCSDKNPLVSVIVPIFNTEKYLPKCIESITKQTYANLEIILVNDGSTDTCPTICDNYAIMDKRIKVIHTENTGVSATRNVGIEVAKGGYITFIDSDDSVDLDTFEVLSEVLIRNKADIVTYNATRVYLNNATRELGINDGEVFYYDNHDEILKKFFTSGVPGESICNKIIRADLIKKLRFDTSIKINEDKLFTYYLFRKCQIYVHINVCKYNYYERRNSASSSNFSKKYFEMEKVVDLINQDVENNYPNLIKTARQQSLQSLLILYDLVPHTRKERHLYHSDRLRLRRKISKYETSESATSANKLGLYIIKYMPPIYDPTKKLYTLFKKMKMSEYRASFREIK